MRCMAVGFAEEASGLSGQSVQPLSHLSLSSSPKAIGGEWGAGEHVSEHSRAKILRISCF